MAHNQYWLLDPACLTAAELEYELRLRRITEVGNGSEGAKGALLRRLLNAEAEGSSELTREYPSPLQLENDLQLIEQSLRQLELWAQTENGEAHEYVSAWSRILHLVARIKRVKPRIPRDHDRKVKLHLAVCALAKRCMMYWLK